MPKNPFLRISVFLSSIGSLSLVAGAFAMSTLGNLEQSEKEKSLNNKKVSCIISGCNGELCVSEGIDEPMMSICMYKEEYSCYQEFGVCEADDNGNCGWRFTEELQKCFDDKAFFKPNVNSIY